VWLSGLRPPRKEFLLALAALPLAPARLLARPAGRKLLLVVAHPDDEYAFAATTYRLARELNWTVDQVVVTNGEGGYRYAALAEALYGVRLADEQDGRANLPAIRKQETLRAGKVLGVRRHYFLDQRDSGFASDAAAAPAEDWDRAHVLRFLTGLLQRERYDAVFTLLPGGATHGHHRAATLLTLEAASRMPEDQRPLLLGADPASSADDAERFTGVAGQPLSRTVSGGPSFAFDRCAGFGFRNALNYQIVVNWVIAEHKSQGLFQADYGRHAVERFWLFAASGRGAEERCVGLARELGAAAAPPAPIQAGGQHLVAATAQ
jgi:N-acetylglucosamine malate deacetylase 2